MKITLNKSHVGIFFLGIIILSVCAVLISPSELCTADGIRNSLCSEIVSRLAATFVLTLVLFVPYLASFFLDQKYFESWIKFAVWAVPIIILITPFTLGIKEYGFIDTRPLLYVFAPYVLYLGISAYLLLSKG